MQTFLKIAFLLLFAHFVECEKSNETEVKDRSGRNLKLITDSLSQSFQRQDGFFGPALGEPDLLRHRALTSDNAISKTPRGFADFISGDSTSVPDPVDDRQNNWSPYYLPPITDYFQNSGSNVDSNVWKREDERYAEPSNYSPDYSKMFMMMQAMKKMDSGSSSKPGLLTRILDNPTTLVMATFIPLSLIIAASLPVIVNVMMNGVTIPAIIPSSGGTKTRSFQSGNSSAIFGSVLESMVDLGARYMNNPDCFQKIFCEMTIKSDKNAVPAAKYLKKAAKVATFFVNDDTLRKVGVESLIKAIKKGTCDQVKCEKLDKSSSNLFDTIKKQIHNHSYKTMPLKSK